MAADLAQARVTTAEPALAELSTAGAAFELAAPEMAARLAQVLDAARPGGLSGVSSEQALSVVEAVEAVKAWVDSVSLDATTAMVREFETDFVHLGPEPSHSNPQSTWEWRRFFRTCRSAVARETRLRPGCRSPRVSAGCGCPRVSRSGSTRCLRR